MVKYIYKLEGYERGLVVRVLVKSQEWVYDTPRRLASANFLFELFMLGWNPEVPHEEKELVLLFNSVRARDEFEYELLKRIAPCQVLDRTRAQSLEVMCDLVFFGLDLPSSIDGEYDDTVPECPKVEVVEKREFHFKLVFTVLALISSIFSLIAAGFDLAKQKTCILPYLPSLCFHSILAC